MENIILTKFAEELLAQIYSEYKRKLKEGKDSVSTQYFGGSEYFQRRFSPQKPIAEITRALLELNDYGLIDAFICDDTVGELYLANPGIAFMESRYTRKADSFFHWIARLRSLLPF